MTSIAPPSVAVSSPPRSEVSWSNASLLVVALVAFAWSADLQGVAAGLTKRSFDGVDGFSAGVAYAVFAVLLLWHWDWVLRVLSAPRFVVAFGVGASLIAGGTWLAQDAATPQHSSVPVLRAEARQGLPVLPVALAAAPTSISWTLPEKPDGTLKAYLQDREERRAQMRAQSQGQDQPTKQFDYALPKGWTVQAPTSMRSVNLRPADDARAECYLTQLGGDGGGLLANINRWRTTQMGLAAIDDAALAKLPRTKLFGRDAVLVEFDGTFTDSMNGKNLADARMLGAIVSLPAVTLFVKMTGPRDLVTRERAGFDQFVASLALAGQGTKPSGEPAKPADPSKATKPAEVPAAKSSGSSGLRWTVPSEWNVGPARAMREATLVPKAAADCECAVSILGGDGGGLVNNVNRWRSDQFGASRLSDEEVAKLPKLPVLGREATLVEAKGSYAGMGGQKRDDFALLGLICPLEGRVLFVKMVGPAAQMASERERFLSFCKSLGKE